MNVTPADREAADGLLAWMDRGLHKAGESNEQAFAEYFAAHRRRERERIVGMIETEAHIQRAFAAEAHRKNSDDFNEDDGDLFAHCAAILNDLKHQLESEA